MQGQRSHPQMGPQRLKPADFDGSNGTTEGVPFPVSPMLHIGIVACSTEGAALCYRTISLEGGQMIGRHDHPEVSLHSFPLAEYMRSIDTGDWARVAELM